MKNIAHPNDAIKSFPRQSTPLNLLFSNMFGLKKKLLVFGPMAMSALMILAMLVASVKCDDGVVSSLRMMQEVDGVAATSVPRNTVLVSDHHTPTLYIFK